MGSYLKHRQVPIVLTDDSGSMSGVFVCCSYNTNLAYLLALKCQGKEIQGEAAVERLVELRTVIEKIRQDDE